LKKSGDIWLSIPLVEGDCHDCPDPRYGQRLDPGGWTELGVLVSVENGLRREALLTARCGRMRWLNPPNTEKYSDRVAR